MNNEANDNAVRSAEEVLVMRMFEAYERGAIAELLEFWSSDAMNHAGLTPEAERRVREAGLLPSGADGLRMVFESLLTAFPDRKWRMEDIMIAGDKVICRMTVSGTHQGVPAMPVEGGPLLQALQPTGRPYSVAHIHIFRMASGKIAEHWAVRDDLGLLVQLGAVPSAPARKPA